MNSNHKNHHFLEDFFLLLLFLVIWLTSFDKFTENGIVQKFTT
jgi:hypothetical protein